MRYFLVPMEFIGKDVTQCRPTHNSMIPNHNEYRLGCHCIRKYKTCQELLWFLILDGRFNVRSNTNMIYREAVTTFAFKSVNNFDAMIQDVVLTAFERKFSQKNLFLNHKNPRYKDVSDITTENKCVKFGPDCVVALRGINDVLRQIFRNSFALNKDLILGDVTAHSQRRERYYGTLLVNKNFDYSEEQNHEYQINPDANQMKNDLTKLLGITFPFQNVTFVRFMAKLGYADNFGTEDQDAVFNLTKEMSFIKRSDNEIIMSSMKHSLDLSDPWIPQYYNINITKFKQAGYISRNLYKYWLLEESNGVQKLLSNGFKLGSLQNWRYSLLQI